MPKQLRLGNIYTNLSGVPVWVVGVFNGSTVVARPVEDRDNSRAEKVAMSAIVAWPLEEENPKGRLVYTEGVKP